MLLTTHARRRALAAWLDRARTAWHKIGRLYLESLGAQLDGRGDTCRTRRLQVALARCRRYIRRCEAALRALPAPLA